MKRNYRSVVRRREDLPDDVIHAMVDLYLENFDGSSAALFRRDLADKDEAILIYCDQQLVGFTTIQFIKIIWQDSPAIIVYSGDTIVSPLHWGQQALSFAWIKRIGQVKQSAPFTPLFWFLLVKGHRTYKYLSVFGKSFYPHWKESREDLKQLADQLASDKFGKDYDAAAGVVKFPISQGHLKKEIAHASTNEMKKEPIQFFFQKNPGYQVGHELVCICELELFNMKPLVGRLFQSDGESTSQ